MNLKLALNWKSLVIVAGIVGSAAASAAPTFLPNYLLKSALKDDSNLDFQVTNYSVLFSQDASDPDLYINSFNMNFGAGWDPLINLNLGTTFTGYTLGSQITGATTFNLENVVNRTGTLNNAIAEGIYDFSLDILGGATNSSSGILTTINYQLEVYNRIDFTISANATPNIIGQGGTSDMKVTLKNDMASRNLLTTTWYTGGNGGPFTDGLGNNLGANFTGNWFSKTIVPGDSRTDDHTQWFATATQVLGTYSGGFGIVAGINPGDEFFIKAPVTTIQVVPEPVSVCALGLGALALLRKRKQNRS
jgi:hypothetical protein